MSRGFALEEPWPYGMMVLTSQVLPKLYRGLLVWNIEWPSDNGHLHYIFMCVYMAQEYCGLALSQDTSGLMERTFVSGSVTVLVAGISDVHLVPRQEWLLVVIDMRKVGTNKHLLWQLCACALQIPSMNEAKVVLAGIISRNKALSWTVALQHFLHLEHEPLEKVLCKEAGFDICRRFHICALSSVPSKGLGM